MSTIITAAREYAQRPPDERYDSLPALIQAAEYDRAHSAERVYNLRDLKAVAVSTLTSARPQQDQTIQLESPNGRARMTHWAFGQLARTVGAPAAYLRTLPPAIAADALNYGLHDAAPVGTRANLLVRANGGEPLIRAATSDSYGRVWDADLYGEINRWFGDGTQSAGGSWQSPPTWTGESAGQYRGDRDSFVIRIDGGSIVTDPSARTGSPSGDERNTGQLYRGIMIRNSEVGHCSISIECVLYRYICGNHMLWGAVIDRKFRRRHVGDRITRDTMTEVLSMARAFNQRSASQDERIIDGLIRYELAHTKDAVIDELRKLGATKDEATAAYDTCEQKEAASPRSFWGLAQGFTRNSQASGYQDDRLHLDQFAAQLIARGAKLVTV